MFRSRPLPPPLLWLMLVVPTLMALMLILIVTSPTPLSLVALLRWK